MDTINFLKFVELCGDLKHLKRTGWVNSGVKGPETVASHMWRMAIMILTVDSKVLGLLDRQKCIRMALAHDLAECVVGDITPHCNVTAEDKHNREKTAMNEICGLLGDEQKTELICLWEEYEEQATGESKFVRDLDKLDMVVQANEYEKGNLVSMSCNVMPVYL
eukprot:Lankesteria_metandrocarpae@DN4100_c0_g1_i1.p2